MVSNPSLFRRFSLSPNGKMAAKPSLWGQLLSARRMIFPDLEDTSKESVQKKEERST